MRRHAELVEALPDIYAVAQSGPHTNTQLYYINQQPFARLRVTNLFNFYYPLVLPVP